MGSYGGRFGDRFDLKAPVVAGAGAPRRGARPKRAYPRALQYSKIEGFVTASLLQYGPTGKILAKPAYVLTNRIRIKLISQTAGRFALRAVLSLNNIIKARISHKLTLETFKPQTKDEAKTKKILTAVLASLLSKNNAELDDLD